MALDTSLFGDLGGAVSDLFGAVGDQSEASAYGKAAAIAQQNAQLTAVSTGVQSVQQQRQAYQVIGSEQAETAAAGFSTQSGSAGDLLRSSAQQSALAQGLIHIQGAVTQAGFQAQAAAYTGQEAAAKAASGGGFLGGLLGIASGIASIF